MKTSKNSVDTYDILVTTTLIHIKTCSHIVQDNLALGVFALAIESLETSLEFVKLLWERIEELEAQVNREGTGEEVGRPMGDNQDSESPQDADTSS